MAALFFGGFMSVIKVEPWGKDQGEYVLIDESDFDDKKHKLYSEVKKEQKVKESKRLNKNASTNQ